MAIRPADHLINRRDATCIQNGDVCIVYQNIGAVAFSKVDNKSIFHNKLGKFSMKDWIGKPYGSKIESTDGSGWICVLALTPELWTVVLRHRTQILYAADISMVCLQLELRPGCKVLESGTGSGSLTTSLARAIAPSGQVLTFEFHEERANVARDEFKQNGLEELVTVIHRDIEALGFPEDLVNTADAVFLDLPGPWKAISSAVASLRPNGMICSFSPCIEQVQRACEALHGSGCKDIFTLEVLLREFNLSLDRQNTELQEMISVQIGQPNGMGSKRPKTIDGEHEDGILQCHIDNEEIKASGLVIESERNKKKDKTILARPCFNGRGHTGYLTFARKGIVE